MEISTPPAGTPPAATRVAAAVRATPQPGLWRHPAPPLDQLLRVARDGDWTMSNWARRRRTWWLLTVTAAARVPAGLVLRAIHGADSPGYRGELPPMRQTVADTAGRDPLPRLGLRAGYVAAALLARACESAPRAGLTALGLWFGVNWLNNVPGMGWAVPDVITGEFWWSAMFANPAADAVAVWAGRVLLAAGGLVMLAVLWRLGVLRWAYRVGKWLFKTLLVEKKDGDEE